MVDRSEPKEAFPYRPPDENIKKKYRHIFELEQPLENKLPKVIFDKAVSALILIVASPVFIGLYIANLIEGLIIPENKGPLFFLLHRCKRRETIQKNIKSV